MTDVIIPEKEIKKSTKVYVPKPFTKVSPDINTTITQQKEYSQTWLEFAAQKYEQIIRSNQETGSSNGVVIYTTPANSTLFLTSFTHTSANNLAGTGTASSYLYFSISSSGTRNVLSALVHIINTTDASATMNTANSFPMPIKIPPNTSVIIQGSNVSVATGTIQGFLVPFVV